MAWSAKTDATQLTSITTEEYFTTAITLNAGELADIQLQATFVASAVDDAIFSFYATLDDTSETWDEEPFMAVTLPAQDNSQNTRSVTVSGKYKFRVGVKRSGTTNTITNADMAFRTDGISG